MITRIERKVDGQGLFDITRDVTSAISEAGADGDGLCTLFIRHTSASLLVQENYDPRVLDDLQSWMVRMVPQNSSLYTHDDEGPDDMPAHIRSALTASSLSIPLIDGELALGRWQAVYLWEHRENPGPRTILLHLAE
ncbi:MAG: hypothetical protein CMQ05_12175 [Gammaproteobacteria bacterium]|nr:hypothetical protein [Gammaproteobacteria bacterium]RPG25136.1 MAG: YjbQ family protein [Gammaproteobacteria bacterium TMED50]|tara:strand:- start:525 stop:935 length:411 start_codon:yes stop_codon:yes gene_type:complete